MERCNSSGRRGGEGMTVEAEYNDDGDDDDETAHTRPHTFPPLPTLPPPLPSLSPPPPSNVNFYLVI
jgi:hypothetical protein